MKNSKSFSFKIESLRKLPDPVYPEKYQRYFAVCDTKNLPKDFPMDTNPRKQNLKTSVAKKIKESYCGKDTDQLFHILNRGILLSAGDVSFDNSNNVVTITMSDINVHGLVDGGHTYRIVVDNLQDLTQDQFVTLEILTGIESNFESLAGARNTSVQVKEKSLAELEGKLNVIKQLISKLPFANDVAYVENEDKDIDVQEIIAILSIFHNKINTTSQPVFTYSSKAAALRLYLENMESYSAFINVAPEIFKLHDHVKATMKSKYTGFFGALKEIGYKDGKKKWPLYFSPKDNNDYQRIAYDIPAGFIYPILGSMRFLLDFDKATGGYKWKTDPIAFYDTVVGEKLIALTMEASSELGRNPMAVGKSPRHWEGLYNSVIAAYFQKQ